MATVTDRDKYIKMDDINHVSRALDWEKIRLHPKDEISIRKWLDVLRLEGANVFCKDKMDRALLRSGLSEDAFCLVLQTGFQSEMFQELGNVLICVVVISSRYELEKYRSLINGLATAEQPF